VRKHLTHSVNTEHCEAQYNAHSLSVMLLTEWNTGTIQTESVWEMSKRKSIYKNVLIVIFWKFLENAEFVIIFFVSLYSWHLYGLLLFNNHLVIF